MKKLFFTLAILSSAVMARGQAICDSCCEESFPYEFCNVTLPGIHLMCSKNPNADGTPAKAFIPSCVIVDSMPSNAVWQPIGPPVRPADVVSDDSLGDDSDEEAGAASQQSSDETLFDQIPSQPPVPPTPVSPPENTCGVDPFPPGTLEYPTRQDILDNYISQGEIGNTYAEWGTPTPSDYPVPPWKNRWKDNGINQDIWDYDEDEYDASLAQFCLDTSNFLEGLSPQHIDGADSGYDDNGIDLANSYYALDNEMLDGEYNREIDSVNGDETKHDDWVSCDSTFEADSASDAINYEKYEGATIQYTADSLAWVANENNYVQLFNQTQAQADANLALANWQNQCHPPITPCESNPPCCIHVKMITNSNAFTNPIGILAQTIDTTNLADTTTFLTCRPASCSNNIIEVNVSSAFLGEEREIGITPIDQSQYGLHQVSPTEFYTGFDPPDSSQVAQGYGAYSFFQLMEHEMGHYWGLHHPDQPVNGEECSNCYTANPFWTAVGGPSGTVYASGYRTVMALNNNIPNPGYNAPVPLTSEDECQFQKLYCNTCADSSGDTLKGPAPCAYDAGVSAPERDEFEANIHPNPSTGAMELDYTLTNFALVQVSIYNVLGVQVLQVFSGYEPVGTQSISLGTESLPSGNYVCRVRVGDQVNYINLSITK